MKSKKMLKDLESEVNRLSRAFFFGCLLIIKFEKCSWSFIILQNLSSIEISCHGKKDNHKDARNFIIHGEDVPILDQSLVSRDIFCLVILIMFLIFTKNPGFGNSFGISFDWFSWLFQNCF